MSLEGDIRKSVKYVKLRFLERFKGLTHAENIAMKKEIISNVMSARWQNWKICMLLPLITQQQYTDGFTW